MRCTFCNGKNKIINQSLDHNGDFTAEIIDSNIKIHILTSDGNGRYKDGFTDLYIPINYCPICGNKVEG